VNELGNWKGNAMTDRIKELWDERTPFGSGEDWPVMVDQFLEEGVSEDEVDGWVQKTASILHSNGDALDVAVKGERIVGVRGGGVDRVNNIHLLRGTIGKPGCGVLHINRP
jgi:hypothetical protein